MYRCAIKRGVWGGILLVGSGVFAGTEPEPVARDPFAVSGQLQAYATPQATGYDARSRFTATKPQVLPKMRMRGYLKGKNGESVALLEIADDRVHIIREDDDVGLHELGNDAVIRIKTIHRLHLVVEAGTLGQVIIVR